MSLWLAANISRALALVLSVRAPNIPAISASLKNRFVGEQGQRRLEIFPAENVREQLRLRRFVSSVQEVAPRATGSPVIIVAAGLPLSLQVNRLYTLEFFNAASRALAPAGIVAVKVETQGAYMGPEFTKLVTSLLNALRRVFTHVEFLPGETIHIVASDSPLAERRSRLVETLLMRAVPTAYLNEHVLRERLAPLRTAQLDSLLALHDDGAVNSDTRPVTFSHALSIWAKHFRTGKAVDWAVARLDLGVSVLLLSGVALVVVAAYTRGSRLGIGAAAPFACLYAMGFTTMFSQVLLMLCFQVSRGYVYSRLAVIIAAFMVGLGITATLGAGRLSRAREYRGLILLQAAMICLPVLVIAAFGWAEGAGAGLPGTAVDALYALLAFAGGSLGAAVFTVASAALMRRRAAPVEAGSLSYSIDLVGASLAGFTTGFLTIPALGIVNAALAIALVNFVVLGVLQFASRRSPGPRPR